MKSSRALAAVALAMAACTDPVGPRLTAPPSPRRDGEQEQHPGQLLDLPASHRQPVGQVPPDAHRGRGEPPAVALVVVALDWTCVAGRGLWNSAQGSGRDGHVIALIGTGLDPL